MSEPVFQKEVLENGLTVLTENIPHLRSISLGVWLKKGSQDELAQDAGVYHFIEHMLFKGTDTKDAYEIARIIDSIGGFADAFTSKENTCFYAKLLDEHLPVVLELFSDILLRPRFDGEDIEKERKVIQEEFKMVEDTPGDLVHELFLENYWPDHPLGRPILGTAETIQSIGPQLIRECFRQNYIPSNMVVSAAGRIDHAALVDSIRRYFPFPPAGNGHATTPPPPVKAKPVVLLRAKKDLEQAHLCLGTMSYPMHHPLRYAANVMNVILGGSMSSRLFQKLREEQGLCYSVFSSLTPFLDCGYISIYAATGKNEVRTATELILDECRQLAREAVVMDELENAKNHLKGSLILSLESSSSRMFNMARNDMFYGRQISAGEILDNISKVTLDDVQQVAMELFLHQEYGIVVVGDLEELHLDLKNFQMQ